MEEERLRILEMVGAGDITPEQAAELLAALDTPAEAASASPPSLPPAELRESRWARFWVYPLMAGGTVLILGALIMALVYSTDAARGWRVCGWLPMILGLGVMLIAWWTRSATWLHLRVREEDGQKVAFSFPLPLTLAAWVLRLAQPFVPQLKDTGVDDLIIALRQGKSRNEPLFINVEDDEKGESVEIYIG
ncbi:MAG: SHOCT-like domain-containing protein [Anaerolineae bacterium]|jgi:MFS family permease